REEIKARYNAPEGVTAQRALAWVMARHIDGSIPTVIMDGTFRGAWDSQANTLDGRPAGETVGTARYDQWLAQRGVAQRFDAYYPEQPTAIRRKFDLAREIPEEEVERLMIEL